MTNKKNNSKFDFNQILDNICQVIPNKFSTPEPVSGDQLGESLKELSIIASNAAKQYAELTQHMYELESGINALFVQIEQLRDTASSEKKSGEQSSSSNATVNYDKKTSADENIDSN